MKLTPNKCHEDKRKTKTVQVRKDMTKIVKQMESNDTDVLNCVSGKYFHQYERDRLHSPSVLRRQKKINDKTLQQGKKMV